jgi:hypothetical protein
MGIVYNIYMFHEMPDDARALAMQEIARVWWLAGDHRLSSVGLPGEIR